MSGRIFQNIVLQFKETTDTVIGVIDSEGTVIACTDLPEIGQRWPHLVAVAIGVLFVLLGWRWLLVLGALAAAASAAIGVFHVGVEQAWWEGLQSCTGNSIAGLNTADLLNPAVDVAPVARCTDIAWAMFGISMAGWNVLISAGLAVIWLLALRKK